MIELQGGLVKEKWYNYIIIIDIENKFRVHIFIELEKRKSVEVDQFQTFRLRIKIINNSVWIMFNYIYTRIIFEVKYSKNRILVQDKRIFLHPLNLIKRIKIFNNKEIYIFSIKQFFWNYVSLKSISISFSWT